MVHTPFVRLLQVLSTLSAPPVTPYFRSTISCHSTLLLGAMHRLLLRSYMYTLNSHSSWPSTPWNPQLEGFEKVKAASGVLAAACPLLLCCS